MARISLTTFVDIVASSGTSKITKTRKALREDGYHPSKDFYKAIREGIINLHQHDLPKKSLLNLLDKISDKKKISNYNAIVNSYLKWIGSKKYKWFDPVHSEFGTEKIKIKVNPEIGLEHKNKKYLIKLYFKADPLSKSKADIIMGLMNMSLRLPATDNVIMSVLDIRRTKLHTPTINIPMLQTAVNAEIKYIEAFAEAL